MGPRGPPIGPAGRVPGGAEREELERAGRGDVARGLAGRPRLRLGARLRGGGLGRAA